MFLVIIVLSVVVQGLIALFVFQKNNKNLTNVLFFLLSASLVTWAVINFIITDDPHSSSQLILYRLLMASVVVQNTFFFLFVRTYPSYKLSISSKRLKAYLALSFVAVLTALSPILFTSVEYGAEGARPVTGPGMLIFVLHAGISVVLGLRSLFRLHRKSHGTAKQQVKLILIASVILWGIVPITNFVISIALETLVFARISPIYTLAFSSIIAYAIVAKKLFDIKRAVARSVAYLLSLGSIGLIYGATIFLLSSIFITDNKIDSIARASYITLALMSALLYSPTKKFFDKLTNQIFYRDAYDPEAFLDELNSTIVGTIELGILLRHVTSVIQKNLKTEHCFIEVLPTPTTPSKVIGVGSISLGRVESEYIIHSLEKSGKEVLITDDLRHDNNKLKNLLSSKNIGVIVRLIPSNIQSTEAIAHLIIGTKKSGNVYDKQDIRTLEIISDELLIAIENALRFEEIQGFATKLQTEVNTATSKLQRTNKKLRELDETKDEFISMASHQLRTPLTSVKGYMSMVLEGDAGKITKQQRKLLNQAFVSSQRMVYLIADLLNVSRLKTGKFVIESNPTNLAEVIEGEIGQLRETAKAKKIDIKYEKPKNFPTLTLDETKIRQVIMNFVDNAIYYTPSGGKVKVELSEDKSNVYFKVTDNGLGVPKADQTHLFTKFYRASNARKARPDGTGLGLFMAKKIIDNQGGNLLFESVENRGSTFGFCFEKKKHLVKKHTP